MSLACHLATSLGEGPIQVGPVKIPLSVDAWFNLTLPLILSSHPFFPKWLGSLDSTGKATAAWTLPTKSNTKLIGTTLWQAYVVYDSAGFHFASNGVPMTLLK